MRSISYLSGRARHWGCRNEKWKIYLKAGEFPRFFLVIETVVLLHYVQLQPFKMSNPVYTLTEGRSETRISTGSV